MDSSRSARSARAGTPTARLVRDAISKIDFWPKQKADIRTRSRSGAVASIVGMVVLLLLFISETYFYMSPIREDSLMVDTSFTDERVTFRFDLGFFELTCDEVVIDLIDQQGIHLGEDAGLDYAKTPVNPDQLKGMGILRRFKKGWLGGWSSDKKGCRVLGTAKLRKVKGNLHIAAGSTSTMGHGGHEHHVHTVTPQHLKPGGFNVSHKVFDFKFGDYFPGRKNLFLGDAVYVENDAAQVVYLLQLVPVSYTRASGRSYAGYQVAGTRAIKRVNPKSPVFPLPGLFVKWDYSSFRMHQREVGLTFGQYFARVCSLVGGTFVVLGLLYSGGSAVVSSVQKKNECVKEHDRSQLQTFAQRTLAWFDQYATACVYFS